MAVLPFVKEQLTAPRAERAASHERAAGWRTRLAPQLRFIKFGGLSSSVIELCVREKLMKLRLGAILYASTKTAYGMTIPPAPKLRRGIKMTAHFREGWNEFNDPGFGMIGRMYRDL